MMARSANVVVELAGGELHLGPVPAGGRRKLSYGSRTVGEHVRPGVAVQDVDVGTVVRSLVDDGRVAPQPSALKSPPNGESLVEAVAFEAAGDEGVVVPGRAIYPAGWHRERGVGQDGWELAAKDSRNAPVSFLAERTCSPTVRPRGPLHLGDLADRPTVRVGRVDELAVRPVRVPDRPRLRTAVRGGRYG